MQKIKTLVNSLMLGKLGNREFLEEMLIALDIDLKIRAEKLSLEKFTEITNYIYQKSKN